jgi:hypothetical protein
MPFSTVKYQIHIECDHAHSSAVPDVLFPPRMEHRVPNGEGQCGLLHQSVRSARELLKRRLADIFRLAS